MAKLDSNIEQRNFSHLVGDIAWFGFASATTRFLPYFALRMGATPLEVGLITSLPAVVLFVANWLSSWWHRRYENSLRAMLWPTILNRMVFLLPAFAPFFPVEWRPVWIILAVMLPALGSGVSSTVFIVMMREAVQKEQLTLLIARRKLWMSVAIGAGTLLAGLLLEAWAFPQNYQIVFLVALGASLVSLRHLLQIRVESRKPPPSVQIASPDTRSVIFVTLAAYVSFNFVVAAIPVHLKSLGANEGFIAIFGVVELLGAVASTVVAVRLVRLLGNRSMVAISVMATAIAAAILGLTANLWVTLIASALTGGAWTLADIALFGYFAERANTENMGATIIYNQMMYVGIFIGPLLGNGLLELGMSTVSVLLIGAGLRLIGGILVQLGASNVKATGSSDLATIE
jgi:MFS family permease